MDILHRYITYVDIYMYMYVYFQHQYPKISFNTFTYIYCTYSSRDQRVIKISSESNYA